MTQWAGRVHRPTTSFISTIPDAAAVNKELLTGAFADIMIESAHATRLWGRLIRGQVNAAPGKGETTIAA
jgi:hypothetical protein